MAISAAAIHIAYQLPNRNSRVGFLLDNIECEDTALQAAIAVIEEDDGPDGKRNDFEAAAAHILPKDPVVKKQLLAAKRGLA